MTIKYAFAYSLPISNILYSTKIDVNRDAIQCQPCNVSDFCPSVRNHFRKRATFASRRFLAASKQKFITDTQYLCYFL